MSRTQGQKQNEDVPIFGGRHFQPNPKNANQKKKRESRFRPSGTRLGIPPSVLSVNALCELGVTEFLLLPSYGNSAESILLRNRRVFYNFILFYTEPSNNRDIPPPIHPVHPDYFNVQKNVGPRHPIIRQKRSGGMWLPHGISTCGGRGLLRRIRRGRLPIRAELDNHARDVVAAPLLQRPFDLDKMPKGASGAKGG